LAQLSSAAIALLWIAAIAVLGLADRLIDPLTPSIEQPDLVKLNGEWREVSALFTDIEGFTATTHRAGAPRIWWQRSTCIFEGVAGIVINHGGMIDKSS
jgi:adenylate cyclase